MLQNVDNGGNERDSSKIEQETQPEIHKRNFWCNKIFPKKKVRRKFHRNRTGNRIFWALGIHNLCQIYSITIEHVTINILQVHCHLVQIT